MKMMIIIITIKCSGGANESGACINTAQKLTTKTLSRATDIILWYADVGLYKFINITCFLFIVI